MSVPVDSTQLKVGDMVTIQSKKGSENHDGCVFKVKSNKASSSGWVGLEISSINNIPVKRGEKGLKLSGVFENDCLFFQLNPTVKVRPQNIYLFLYYCISILI